jgi:hypothetical protein
MIHYNAALRRAAQTTVALSRAQRKSSLAGVPLPDDIRAAQERVPSQEQAASLAIRTRDYAAGEQTLREMEDTLGVIEDFLAKTGATINGNPQTR